MLFGTNFFILQIEKPPVYLFVKITTDHTKYLSFHTEGKIIYQFQDNIDIELVTQSYTLGSQSHTECITVPICEIIKTKWKQMIHKGVYFVNIFAQMLFTASNYKYTLCNWYVNCLHYLFFEILLYHQS